MIRIHPRYYCNIHTLVIILSIMSSKAPENLELCEILRHTIIDLNQTIKNMETEVLFLRKDNIRLTSENMKYFEMLLNSNKPKQALHLFTSTETKKEQTPSSLSSSSGFGGYASNEWK